MPCHVLLRLLPFRELCVAKAPQKVVGKLDISIKINHSKCHFSKGNDYRRLKKSTILPL